VLHIVNDRRIHTAKIPSRQSGANGKAAEIAEPYMMEICRQRSSRRKELFESTGIWPVQPVLWPHRPLAFPAGDAGTDRLAAHNNVPDKKFVRFLFTAGASLRRTGVAPVLR
jgi:hypothetical protein